MDGSVPFAMAFAAGVLSFLSPCVLPVVPGYLAFITGMSRDELEQTTSRRQVLIAAAFFVSGFSLVLLAMGASASLLGQRFLQYREWIARIGGVLIILFGLHMLGFLRTGVLMRERRLQYSGRPATKLAAGAAGIVFAAGWTPCIGPVLGTLWTLAGVRGTMWGAMLYSVATRSAWRFRSCLPPRQQVHSSSHRAGFEASFRSWSVHQE